MIKLTPDQAWPMLMAGSAVLHLAEGQILARVRAMGVHRIELTGFNDLGVERLKAMGLISEIVSWKLRLFVPTGSDGPVILGTLLENASRSAAFLTAAGTPAPPDTADLLIGIRSNYV